MVTKPVGLVRLMDWFCAALLFASIALWACEVEVWTISRFFSLGTGLWMVSALVARC